MRETQKQEKGITLIALVLTIIILMILAAVSVATLTGDNGILTKAQEAKEATEKAEIEEQLRIAQLNAKINKAGGAITIKEYLEEVNKLKETGIKDIVTEYEESTYETYNADAVVIAKGKYIYGINQATEGDIEINYIGNDPKELPPTIEVAEISNTTNSITVKVASWRNDGGVLEFYLKGKEDTEYSLENTESRIQTGKQYTYTYNGLVQGETYQIQIIAKTESGKTATETATIKTKVIYTVTYDANGGTGAPDTDTKIEGIDLTLNTTTVPTREGYTFKGWGTSPTATDVVTTYTINEHITFYAIWKFDFVSFSNGSEGYVAGEQLHWETSCFLPSNVNEIYFRLDPTGGNPVQGDGLGGGGLTKYTLNGKQLSLTKCGQSTPDTNGRYWSDYKADVSGGGLLEMEFNISLTDSRDGHFQTVFTMQKITDLDGNAIDFK